MRKVYIDINIIKKILISLIYSIFIGILTIPTLEMLNYTNMEILIMNIFGHIELEDIIYLTPILTFIIYLIYISYILADYMVKDLNERASYVFTRTKQRNKWFLIKCLNLFIYIFLYYALHFTVVVIMGMIYKLEITAATFFTIVEIFCLITLFSYFIILIVNTFSLYIDVFKSYALINIINIISLLISYIFATTSEHTRIITLLPVAQGIASWHENMIPTMQRGYIFDFYISNFNFMYSVGYLFLLCAICIGIGISRVEKMDIL